MILPVQITYRNMENIVEAEQWVQAEAAKLDKYYDRITSCRVLIEVPHAHRAWGRVYHVRIDLGVPGDELVVKHEPTLGPAARQVGRKRVSKHLEIGNSYKDLHLAIRNAFKTARRLLQDYARRQRGDVKLHEPGPRGHILRVFREKEFGFLESSDGREIYFHRNAVANGDFDRLKAGTAVVFSEEPGEKGPQATMVKARL